MCSTTRGPAIWPSLVTWPTRMTAAPVLLGEADQRLGADAHLRDGAGRRFDAVGPHGLDRIDDDEDAAAGRPASVARMSSTVVSAASSTGGVGEPEPLGAQAHLRHRLLAGDIDDALAALRQRGRGLDQQRRLADARIAADQQHRAAHEAAAGDAVELGDAGRDARRFRAAALQGLEREQAALAAGALPRQGTAACAAFPRRSCSTRRRRRTCPASADRRRRSSGRRRSGELWPSRFAVTEVLIRG